MKSPTHISPSASGAAVAAHEGEHVNRERAKAARQGREVILQTVQIFTAICPECGRVYVSGGETRTVIAEGSRDQQPQKTEPGQIVDMYA